MNRKLILAIAGALLCASVFQSCKKDDDDKKEDTGKSATVMLDCTDYAKWQYFSLKTGELVGSGDINDDAAWNTRTDWDIAFHRQDVRTNSGKSGAGQGGIKEASSIDFDAVTTTTAEGFVVDDTLSILAGGMGSPNAGMKVPSSATTVTQNWVKLDMASATWTVTKKVFILKTGAGKYAKIYLKGFVNEENKSGHVTLQYFYQDNGSTTLE